MANTLPSPRQIARDIKPVVPSTSTWESSGPTASSARMTRSFAAMTSSRKDAASSGAPRRDLPEGAGADQFAVTLGLSLANQ